MLQSLLMRMDPVRLKKLNPTDYCRHMSQKAYAGERMAKTVFGRPLPEKKNEYLRAMEQGEDACARLRDRDREFDFVMETRMVGWHGFWWFVGVAAMGVVALGLIALAFAFTIGQTSAQTDTRYDFHRSSR